MEETGKIESGIVQIASQNKAMEKTLFPEAGNRVIHVTDCECSQSNQLLLGICICKLGTVVVRQPEREDTVSGCTPSVTADGAFDSQSEEFDEDDGIIVTANVDVDLGSDDSDNEGGGRRPQGQVRPPGSVSISVKNENRRRSIRRALKWAQAHLRKVTLDRKGVRTTAIDNGFIVVIPFVV